MESCSNTRSLSTVRLLCALSIAIFSALMASASAAQTNSRPASITLVARLESLSVAVSLTGDVCSTNQGWERPHPVCVLVTSSWAVSPNRTTIRVIEGSRSLFSQSSGESNRPSRRVDQLILEQAPDGSERGNPNNQLGKLTLLVEAL